jgi:signal transduction histidine kinase
MARRTLEPIEQAHDAQSRFTSDASHELRTPLAAMKTELEVALRDPHLSKTEMKELLTSNLEEVNKLTQISQTLLRLSRLDHSGLATGRVAMDDIVRRLTERFNRADPRIVYTPPPRPIYITAHQVSIEELVTILLDNALKYSPPTSKVHVVLAREGKKARLDVTNAGKGIKAKDLPYIFDRFYRVDGSRTNGEKPGYGLGLSLAKKIVELHSGDLSASSAPNHETIFTVLLPLYEAPTKSKHKSAK